jgi:hypothetical protein
MRGSAARHPPLGLARHRGWAGRVGRAQPGPRGSALRHSGSRRLERQRGMLHLLPRGASKSSGSAEGRRAGAEAEVSTRDPWAKATHEPGVIRRRAAERAALPAGSVGSNGVDTCRLRRCGTGGITRSLLLTHPCIAAPLVLKLTGNLGGSCADTSHRTRPRVQQSARTLCRRRPAFERGKGPSARGASGFGSRRGNAAWTSPRAASSITRVS